MKLYTVTFTSYVVVAAESEADAMLAAGDALRNNGRDVSVELEDVEPVAAVDQLPPGWDGGCYPFGKDERRIREILAEPKVSP